MKNSILLLLIPAVPIGAMVGWLFIAALPAIAYDVVIDNAKGNLWLIDYLSKIGGIIGIWFAICFVIAIWWVS